MLLILTMSCEKTPKVTDPYEKINGTWIIDNVLILGQSVPGDGSYLKFLPCDDPPCAGVDFDQSDTTTGTFTYAILNDEKTLSIIDTILGIGGNYNGEWEITLFSNKNLHFKINTGLFGDLKIDTHKE